MSLLWINLGFMLVLILISAHLFTNALEYIGEKFKISAGVTGSIFAAIATALPETAVPIIAIVAGTSNRIANEEISVGAILGAPLMLSTLSTLLMALTAIQKRGLRGKLFPERNGLIRDLHCFLIAFSIAAIAMYVPPKPIVWRACISTFLILWYGYYLYLTIRASKNLVNHGYGVSPDEPLLFETIGFSKHTATLFFQLLMGLILLLIGAKGFIDTVEAVSKTMGISALLLSLLIIPIATELPEKVNSILWIRKNKDTLGFGNITGAMVFQGTLLPALGILLTPWQPSTPVVTGITITLIAAIWIRLNISRNGIPLLALLVNGTFYLIYLYKVLH